MDGYTPQGRADDYSSTSAANLGLGFGTRAQEQRPGFAAIVGKIALKPRDPPVKDTRADYVKFGELVDKLDIDFGNFSADTELKRRILAHCGIKRLHVPGTKQAVELANASNYRVGMVFRNIYHNYRVNYSDK